VDQVKLIDTDRWLKVRFLDDQLVTSIEWGAAKGDIRAIQMGYQRLGLMRNGEFLGEVRNQVPIETGAGAQKGHPAL